MKRRQIVIVTLALLAATAGQAQSQTQEYQLEDGRWQATDAAPEPGSPAGRLAAARKALAAEKPYKALEITDAWLREFKLSNHAFLPDAYLIHGDALTAIGREFEALYDYEAIIKTRPESDVYPAALQRELEIALRYLNGLKRRWLGVRIADASDVGVEILIRVQERLPGSQLAERAAIELADYYYRTRQIALASTMYELYLKNHPRGPNRVRAVKRRIYCDLANFKGPKYDASSLLDARARVAEFARQYPLEAERTGVNQGLVSRIDESLALKKMGVARWYLNKGDEASAELVMRRLLAEQPGTRVANQALDIMLERGWIESVELVGEPAATPTTTATTTEEPVAQEAAPPPPPPAAAEPAAPSSQAPQP